LAEDKIFNGRLIIDGVGIITSFLVVEREVGSRVPPLIVEVVVVTEPVVVAIVNETGFFPCFKTIVV
jgi:hypothetical protein